MIKYPKFHISLYFNTKLHLINVTSAIFFLISNFLPLFYDDKYDLRIVIRTIL